MNRGQNQTHAGIAGGRCVRVGEGRQLVDDLLPMERGGWSGWVFVIRSSINLIRLFACSLSLFFHLFLVQISKFSESSSCIVPCPGRAWFRWRKYKICRITITTPPTMAHLAWSLNGNLDLHILVRKGEEEGGEVSWSSAIERGSKGESIKIASFDSLSVHHHQRTR